MPQRLPPEHPAYDALRRWPLELRSVEPDAAPSLEPLGTGLINLSLLATVGQRRYVLQRLNPIFPAVVNEDVEAVTRHLARGGLETPLLVQTRSDALWAELDGQIWRCLTWVPGESLDATDEPELLRSAGALVGRFHARLSQGFEHEFRSLRPGAHDTEAHLEALRVAAQKGAGHRRARELGPLAREILELSAGLERVQGTRPRVIHGDLKLSNLRFRDGQAVALLDLDTLARSSLAIELADGLRSWCNPSGEDRAESRFELDLCEAALRGYGQEARGWLLAEEREGLRAAVALIPLELAARFCRDAYEERYFGWDSTRFASAAEHNELRARGQLSLARSVLQQGRELDLLIRSCLG